MGLLDAVGSMRGRRGKKDLTVPFKRKVSWPLGFSGSLGALFCWIPSSKTVSRGIDFCTTYCGCQCKFTFKLAAVQIFEIYYLPLFWAHFPVDGG